MSDVQLLTRDRISPLELRCRRKALGLSREDFAERLDVRNSTVAKWESGRTHVPEGVRADLEALEDFLDAQTVTYLRGAEGAQRISLGSDEIQSSLHWVAAARAVASLRREGAVVTIEASETSCDHDEGSASNDL